MTSKIIKASAIIHFIGLAICAIILLCLPFYDHIRWNLGYFFLWLTILSALPLIFWKVKKYWKSVLIKLYSFIWWLLLSFCIIPCLYILPGSNVMFFPLKKHYETTDYIIRTGYYGLLDYPNCALYLKDGFIEKYIRRYDILSVDSALIYNNLGAIVLYGDDFSENIQTTDKVIYIKPLNDSIFNKSLPQLKQIESDLRKNHINTQVYLYEQL